MTFQPEKHMELRSFRDFLVRELRPVYGEREAKSLAEALLFYLADIPRTGPVLHPGKRLPEPLIARLLDALEQLKNEKPLQYITGRVEFMGYLLEVDDRVLIPRPETEELVSWVIEENAGACGLRVLDIGTGSGAIAIALKKELPQCEISALDVSDGAIAVARVNAQKNAAEVLFCLEDILAEKEMLPGVIFDIIVSNPPYVTQSDKAAMRMNVTGYEPPLALYVSDHDPLQFYRAIAEFSLSRLKRQGKLYLEINERFGEPCMELLRGKGFRDVTLRKDLSGRDRMIRASRPVSFNVPR